MSVPGTSGGITILAPLPGRRAETVAEEPPPGVAAPPARLRRGSRIRSLMALAIHIDRAIERGTVADYAEVARLGLVSRTQVTRIMGLLHLAPDIQEEILFLDPEDPRACLRLEQDVLPIAMEMEWVAQRKKWDHLESAR